MSKSSYNKWLRNGPSDRWKENESLLVCHALVHWMENNDLVD
ncbi:MAG: hypothetical protein U9N86_12465 [Bacteroidota bacterium]|nr:hypothetical protein [Bacteroidota bacterium]